MMTRGELLKTGAGGALLLALGGCAAPPDRGTTVRAIANAILDGALPSEAAARDAALANAVKGVDIAISGLPPAVQGEIGQLFGLLDFPVTRRLVAGVGPWDRASSADVAAFLERWRTSNTLLFRSGYQALHQLVYAGWYGADESWSAIGYPGPPRIA